MLYYLDRRLIKTEGIVLLKIVGKKEVKGQITEVGDDYFIALRTNKGDANSKEIYEQTFNFNTRLGYSINGQELVRIISEASRIFLPKDVGYNERHEVLEESGLIRKTEQN